MDAVRPVFGTAALYHLQNAAVEKSAVWYYTGRKEGQSLAGFQKIYEQHAKSVYRFFLSLTGDEVMAEELLQETFYQAFLHIDRFEGRSSLYTWLCQIGKNAWSKECRRRKMFADEPLEELAISVKEPTPEGQLIRKDEFSQIRRAILKLEEPYKTVFVLHVYGGLKLKEIAQSYGKTESWARVTYYRAKQRIIQEVSK